MTKKLQAPKRRDKKPAKPPSRPDGPFGKRCYEMFQSAMAVAAPNDMEGDVTVWAMHEIFLLARKHPTWSEQRVWAEALFNAVVEWDMWWEP